MLKATWHLIGALVLGMVFTDGRADALWEITPLVGYRAGGQLEEVPNETNRNLTSHASFGVALGLAPSSSDEHYEMLYSRQATRVQGHSPFDMEVEYLHFGGLVDYADESARYIPYVVGGVGATRLSPHGPGLEQETHWSVSLGGGFKIPVTATVQVRLELRGYFTWLNGRSDIFCRSSDGDAACAIRAKGDGLFQGEALGGVVVRF